MGITLIIVIGIVLATAFSSYFDYLGKKQKKGDKGLEQKINTLEQKVMQLESRITDKDDRIIQIEEDLAFVNKLIDKKD